MQGDNVSISIDKEMTAELRAQVVDHIKYAHINVLIRQDPDDPTRLSSQLLTVPDTTPVCYVRAARILIDLANTLIAVHEKDGCNE